MNVLLSILVVVGVIGLGLLVIVASAALFTSPFDWRNHE